MSAGTEGVFSRQTARTLDAQTLPRRRDEAARLLARVVDPRRDGTCVTLLLGEPGVGRSTLLAAVGEALRQEGVQVMSGGGTRGSGGRLPAALYDALLDPDAYAVLPQVQRAAMLKALAGGADRTGTEEVLSALAVSARGRPLLLVLRDVTVTGDRAREDIHALINGLGGVARTGVSVVLELENCNTASLVRLAESCAPQIVTLPPLAGDDLAALARDTLGAQPDGALIARLTALTGGNPAGSGALLAAWRVAGNIRFVDGYAYLDPCPAVPQLPSWHPALTPLRRLGPRAWSIAAALAVLGPTPESTAAQRLAQASGLPYRVVVESLDEIRAARQAHTVGHEVQISRPLVRASLAEYAGAATRARWCAVVPQPTPPRDARLRILPTRTGNLEGDALRLVAAYREGRWDHVLDQARRVSAGVLPATRSGAPAGRIAALAALIWMRRGRPDRTRGWLNRIGPDGGGSAEQVLAEAAVATVRGESDISREMLRQFLRTGPRARWGEVAAELLEAQVSEGEARRPGDPGDPFSILAAPQTPLEERSGDTFVLENFGGSADDDLWLQLVRARALAGSRPAAAVDAVDLARRLGEVYELGWSCLVAGELGIEPASTLGEALEIFAGLGATPSWCRAAAAARRHRVRVPAPAVGTDGCDEMTRLLLALVADGLPTRLVAKVLRLGHAAVEARLGRLYATTGCRSRAELAAAFGDGKLTAPWL